MTDLLDLKANYKVFEISTGSGYQAATLASLVKSVFSIGIIEPLAKHTQTRLSELKYRHVEVRTGDGYYGWKTEAPFDAIIVTAVASHICATPWVTITTDLVAHY